MYRLSHRYCQNRTFQLCHRQLSTHLLRNISSTTSPRNWKNDTPAGGLTEIMVYEPDPHVSWPDPTLGIFAKSDEKFLLPGNVGGGLQCDEEIDDEDVLSLDDTKFSKVTGRYKVKLFEEVKTHREHQAQTLYSANDYIKYTKGVETYVCSNPVLLDSFPALAAAYNMSEKCRFELHDAPQLLKKEVQGLFPGNSSFTNPKGDLSVITMVQQTTNDMSTWSDLVDNEREQLTDQFVGLAKEVVGRLKSDGYWADFIDPSAGVPYYGRYSNTTMFETDDKYRLLGFRIEDLGCCKVICHKEFGRKVFVGTIFTSVPSSNGVIQDLFEDLNLNHLNTFQSNKSPAEAKIEENQSDILRKSEKRLPLESDEL